MKRKNRPLFVALIAVALALPLNAIPLFAEGSSQPQYQHAQNDTDQRGPSEKPESEPFWVRAVDDPINLFTGILAIFTIILAGASVWQGHLTARAIRKAEASSERQLRAYVFAVSSVRMSPHYVGLRFQIGIKNTGQTPAYKVKIKHRNGIALADAPAFFSLEEDNFSFAIGPGEIIGHNVDIEPFISPEELTAISDGHLSYFVQGEITYVDAFKKCRFTRFRYAYGRDSVSNGALTYCESGNDAN